MIDSHVRRRQRSQGTTLVETAVILPVFITFVFGLIAYGHVQMVSNTLKGATRTAARYGATEGITSAQVEARLKEIMSGGANPAFITVSVKDAAAYDNGSAFPTTGTEIAALPNIELKTAETRQLFVVRATVNYNDVAILPVSWLAGKQLSAQAFMRHE